MVMAYAWLMRGLCMAYAWQVGRRRAACIGRSPSDGQACNPEALDFIRFDRLLSLIPEHTWGLDTTFYLGTVTVTQSRSISAPDWSNMLVSFI